MAIEVFNRYEKKYMLTAYQYKMLIEEIKKHMEWDVYNPNGEFYKIVNVYFDTSSDELIRNSIEGPIYKEKLRLRSYGNPTMDSMVFLEIKKKYNGIVNKRRSSMTLKEAYDYIDNGVVPNSPYVNLQVIKEIDYMINLYNLEPKIYLSYERAAFFDKENPDFRVTFDKNILTRRHNLKMEKSEGQSLIAQDLYLCEVKINSAVPVWFASKLSQLEIYPVSFSKYGTEYKKHNINKGEIKCLNQSFHLQQKLHLA